MNYLICRVHDACEALNDGLFVVPADAWRLHAFSAALSAFRGSGDHAANAEGSLPAPALLRFPFPGAAFLDLAPLSIDPDWDDARPFRILQAAFGDAEAAAALNGKSRRAAEILADRVDDLVDAGREGWRLVDAGDCRLPESSNIDELTAWLDVTRDVEPHPPGPCITFRGHVFEKFADYRFFSATIRPPDLDAWRTAIAG